MTRKPKATPHHPGAAFLLVLFHYYLTYITNYSSIYSPTPQGFVQIYGY